MKKKKLIIAGAFAIVAIIVVGYLILDHFCIIAPQAYSNDHFNIATYCSDNDQDNDGIDDQSDILASVNAYIATKPDYKSKYYNTGYPDDNFGVCTDVVAQGLLGAGYDLMELVNQDIIAHKDDYDIDTIDKNIDFRRVRNLAVYFSHNAISLTCDPTKIDQWQAGDIVIFENHIAVISPKRTADGIPFIIHHAGSFQIRYEEAKLTRYGDIVGHYRIS